MPSECSFDIVSEVNLQEIDNAVNQAMKELKNRFDFKGSKSEITFNRNEKKLSILADDELKLKSLKDVLSTRLAKRSVSMKVLQYGSEEKALDGMVRQSAEIIQGIPQEKAKELVRMIKDMKLKVQPSIQGEKIRVSGKNKDDLQVVMQMVKSANLSIAIQFDNLRS
ncbi:MAG: YajQ family cyclic di-GMP-binding protein [Candidatus Omnitrophica bacterium CG11_big_fil_rev_8_21_14_0_20_45_26]|uniref:Nucleotide-binding protein COV74_05455 n=1 Tax=Candidatus Abzuiibacterium crystallinum TaxID=1974748 RepID=A0A2H0LPG0_9BACT|nr:MAG: YajQ family cyclic di-GMP-binding protein [Candidatus Omnitrophica bacterium CG11_big_fil_rev_8_21_14_0_20_45_26]PIW64337.1 MAG: YajQ family cyclic di-GMP-binding protein [Candidatus Omnitrophica bacterium CG12_big_fil_rev_8_21_14_0_65_45_16]